MRCTKSPVTYLQITQPLLGQKKRAIWSDLIRGHFFWCEYEEHKQCIDFDLSVTHLIFFFLLKINTIDIQVITQIYLWIMEYVGQNIHTHTLLCVFTLPRYWILNAAGMGSINIYVYLDRCKIQFENTKS